MNTAPQPPINTHHVFQHQGGWFAIDVQSMSASAIDAEAAARLPRRAGTPPKAQETENEPVPVANLSLFLTQSCNLNCVYCYGNKGRYGSGGRLSQKTAFQAVDWLIEQSAGMKTLHIGFFGGEPFLNFPMMKKVVNYARQRAQAVGKTMEFNATTNATLLGDEQIAFIKEHGLEVMVSFDGTKDLQDAQRPYANGRGSFDSTLPKIRKLLAAVPETPGHAVLMGNTEPQRVKEALQDIGFAHISVATVSRSLIAREPGTASPLRRVQQHIMALEQEAQTWLDLVDRRDAEGLRRLKDQSGLYAGLTALLHNSKRMHACGAGIGMAAVACSGDIYLCHRFVGRDEYKLGSVFEKELKRQDYQRSPTTHSPVCAVCFARYYCAGGCKHDNAADCGSATTPSEDICRLRRRELELAAVIVASLDPQARAFLTEQQIFSPKPCPLDF
jgi:uncharacterized protein